MTRTTTRDNSLHGLVLASNQKGQNTSSISAPCGVQPQDKKADARWLIDFIFDAQGTILRE